MIVYILVLELLAWQLIHLKWTLSYTCDILAKNLHPTQTPFAPWSLRPFSGTVIVIILCCRYIILQQIMTNFDCFIFQELVFANIQTRKPASLVRSRKYLFKPRSNWTSPPTYNPVRQWLPANCNAVCSHCRTRGGGREASQRKQRSWVVRA